MKNIVYGKNIVLDFIDNDIKKIKHLYLSNNFKLSSKQQNLLNKNNIKVTKLTNEQLDKFLKITNHQGCACEVNDFKFTHFSKIIENPNNYKNILCLDEIHDQQNLGAIIRSAVLFDVDIILMLDHRQAQITPVTYKTSVGAINKIEICKVSNLNLALNELKNNGWFVYASALTNDAIDLNNIKFNDRKVILIGNEGRGMAKLLLKNSDIIFKISTNYKIDSLNCSVATGIILFKALNDKNN